MLYYNLIDELNNVTLVLQKTIAEHDTELKILNTQFLALNEANERTHNDTLVKKTRELESNKTAQQTLNKNYDPLCSGGYCFSVYDILIFTTISLFATIILLLLKSIAIFTLKKFKNK